jgi:AraC-like DNA-binding protein
LGVSPACTCEALVFHSPVGRLLIHHVLGVHRIADEINMGPEADALASATMELVRAWVVSVAGEDPTRRTVARETRVLAYARAHLREPDLTPQRIAWAHNTSVRTLYRLCDDGGVSLEKWIIRRRLEGARADLAAPHTRTVGSCLRRTISDRTTPNCHLFRRIWLLGSGVTCVVRRIPRSFPMNQPHCFAVDTYVGGRLAS